MKIRMERIKSKPTDSILTGVGYDIHRLMGGEGIILCGVKIPSAKSFIAHSDGDVPVHALMDAILSALGENDIGHFFPTSDDRYKKADSCALLLEVLNIAKTKGYKLNNVSISIIAESPVLSPYIDEFKERLSSVTKIDKSKIGISATTNEGIGDIGDGNAIASFAAVTLVRMQSN
ncbi:MAG: 2-C-methyl-D-erythritol 2,4-cyclodiphosphate synthase [Christensenellales bacterium]